MVRTEQIQITHLAQEIVPDKTLLHTRVYGKQLLEVLVKTLTSITTSTIVALSFKGVELMDGSFADEVFGTLAAVRDRRILEVVPFYLTQLDYTSLDNLEMALNSRAVREPADREKLRNCVLPVLKEDSEGLKLVGKVEEHVKQTFELLSLHKQLSARQVADEMKLNINAASTRLKILADLGLAIRNELRDEQGKLYLYQSLV